MSFFSGVSSVPFMILASRGFRSNELAEMHKKHPVLRTGPRTLSYGDTRAIKDIYGHGTKCTKDGSYSITAGSHFHLADVVDKPEHARKRKVLSSAYALKNLENWEFKVTDKAERLLAHFDRVCSKPPAPGRTQFAPHDLNVDLRGWTNFLTLDVMADIGLSTRLGFLDRGSDICAAQRKDGSTYEVNLREALYPTARKQSLIVWNYDWFPVIDKLVDVIPFFGRMQKSAENWGNIVWGLSVERLKRYEAGEQLEDFFQALMEDKNGRPNNLELGEIVAEVNIMMNAGTVTTAISIANAMYQLIKNPACMDRLRKEVDAVLDPDEHVAPYDKVKHLPYLRACLDESLRLFPPTSHGLPREVPPEGMNIMGDWVPGGTSVSMSALVAHRDEKVFPEADKFIPDRWLGESGKALQPYFVAFSAGARSCIGRNIAYLEQTKVVATLVHRYEFALPDPDWELKRLETMNLILGDMPVKLWRRNVD
ncbi:Cytochrome p450 [Aspergillus sp. HF37]|nr:Cytochrome p450 [Aspergillus sp. HF37]